MNEVRNDTQPLHLRGTPREIGYQHGDALGHLIERFLRDRHARVNYLRRSPLYGSKLWKRVRRYFSEVERHLPDLAEEIHGISDGANVPIEAAALLQVRREIIGYSSFAVGECSLVAHLPDNEGAFIAQTVDLEAKLATMGVVLDIEDTRPQQVPRVMMYTLAGLVGFAGMNDAGVAVGINLVLGGRWQYGLSPYLLVRHLLRLRSVEECIDALMSLPRSSSRALTICDGRRLVTVEMTPRELRVIDGRWLCHTNHFLHHDFCTVDAINPFSWRTSVDRMEVLQKKASTLQSPSREDLAALLSDHTLAPSGICVHGSTTMADEETIASLIMEPGYGRFSFTLGKPCVTPLMTVSWTKTMTGHKGESIPAHAQVG